MAVHTTRRRVRTARLRGRLALRAPTAFITGCSGFLGCNLVQRLLGAGWQVVGYDVNDDRNVQRIISTFPNADNFRFVAGDVTDMMALSEAVPDECQYFFHLASNTKVRRHAAHEQNLTNIRGVENVITACRNKRVERLIHTSSISVYFPSTHEYETYIPPRKRTVVLTEDTPRSPDDFWVNYCRTKCIQEKVVQASGLDYVIVQPSDIIGQYDTRSWGRLVRMIADSRLVGIPDTKLNFVNVSDVCEGQLKAALAGKTGETYILGGTPFRTAELIEEIQKNIVRITGCSASPPYMVPLSLLTFLGYVQEWFDGDPMAEATNSPEADESFPAETIFLLSSQHTTSSAKAMQELGYQPTDRAGVVRAIRDMSDFALGYHYDLPRTGQVSASGA